MSLFDPVSTRITSIEIVNGDIEIADDQGFTLTISGASDFATLKQEVANLFPVNDPDQVKTFALSWLLARSDNLTELLQNANQLINKLVTIDMNQVNSSSVFRVTN